MAGNNPSIFEGEGFDFMELREYVYGDDVRKIDWNVTARMQRPFIKVFKEERELNIVIISLLGGSVHFGQKRFKQELIAETAALLAFSAVKNGDVFSSFIFTDKVESYIRPTKNIHAVTKCVTDIYEFDALGKKLDLTQLSKQMYEKIKRKSIIFVLGDFFGDFDFKLLARKHEVICVMTRDKLEEHPPELGFINLIDPSSLESSLMQIDANSVQRYIKALHDKDSELFKHFRKNRIAFTKLYTDEEPFVKMSKLFLRR
ncbi:MAG TPA: DUF58 domain-containing protein [Campylobacterales bacterium]|nr:DUF58 domain-containing protein [Campylobacterales bacterium]